MTDTQSDLASLSPEQRRALLRELLQRKEAAQLEPYPLSYGQKSLWFIQQLVPDCVAFHSIGAFRHRTVTARFDLEAFRKACQTLVDRHSALRTTFRTIDGVPMQVAAPSVDVNLREVDASGWTENELREFLMAEAYRPFDLENEPVYRWYACIRSPNEYITLSVVHHIAFDTWSAGLVFDEIHRLYAAYSEGQPVDLPPPSGQYSDFVRWQNTMLASPDGTRLREYWEDQLAGELRPLDLPTDRPQLPAPTYRGSAHAFVIPPDLTSALRRLSRERGVTLFTTLLSTLHVLLYRYTQQDDILIGAPIAGRSQPWSSGTVGYFNNMVALRGDLADDPTFSEFLMRMRGVVLGALQHQDYPFQLLLEKVRTSRLDERSDLLRVMFAMEQLRRWDIDDLSMTVPTAQATGKEISGVVVEALPLEVRATQMDLVMFAEETGKSLSISLTYNSDLFDRVTVERLGAHWQSILRAIVNDPEQRLSAIPLLSDAERRELLVEWNRGAESSSSPQCIHRALDFWVHHSPQAVAVTSDNEQITYQQLSERSNQLAQHLIELGVQAGDRVAVYLDRSVGFVVALLSILASGATYVVLDPDDPADRITSILEDCHPTLLLTDTHLQPALPDTDARQVCLNEASIVGGHATTPPATPVEPESPACLTYVSGPGGKPIGVVVSHRSVVAKVTGASIVPVDCTSVLLQRSAVSSSGVGFEVWAPLLNGGQVVLAPPHSLTTEELIQIAERYHVTVLPVPADTVRYLHRNDYAWPASVRHILVDAESGPIQMDASIGDNLQVVATFGRPEDTAFSCARTVIPEDESSFRLVFGRPVSGSEIYILDQSMAPVPIGVTGRLYVGGAGLALGYWDQPALTEDRFVSHPFVPGQRLFRTTYLARFGRDGAVEAVGCDIHETKLGDFSVDLHEIEVALSTFQGVHEVAVLPWDEGRGKRLLVAYLAIRERPADESALQIHLRSRVPAYMIPDSFVFLDALPMREDGQVDRDELPLPRPNRARDERFVAPEGVLQNTLQRLWEEVLHVHPIGIRDDFFELGGHSFLAMRLLERIEQVLGVRVSPSALGGAPTIEQLAALLENDVSVDLDTPLVTLRSSGSQPPFFFARGHQEGPSLYAFSLGREFGEDQPYYVLQPGRLDFEGRQPTLPDMAARFIRMIREIQPRGPYYVGGHCEGGMLAYEMAHQLLNAGERVNLVVLVNSVFWTPDPRWPFALINRTVGLLGFSPEKRLTTMLGAQRYMLRLIEVRSLNLKAQLRVIKRFIGRRVGRGDKPQETQRPKGGKGSGLSSGTPTKRQEYDALRSAVFDLHARAGIGYLPPILACPVRMIAPGDEPWRRVYGVRATEADVAKIARDFDMRTFSGRRASYVITHRIAIATQIQSWLTGSRELLGDD